GEIPSGAVNDLSIRSPNLDGNDLPIQFRTLKGSVERALRFLAQRRSSRQLLEVRSMEAVDVESGCGRSIANHVVFDLRGHKAAKHHHSGPDHNAGHQSELSGPEWWCLAAL